MGSFSGDSKLKKLKNKRYKVTITKWDDGILVTLKEYFNDYDDAVIFANKQKGQIKIFNNSDELLFSVIIEKPKNSENHQPHYKHHDENEMYA
jgi:hypothetical protein